MTEQEAFLVLNAIPELGSVRIRNLTAYFGSADKVIKGSLSALLRVEGIGRRLAGEISSWQKHFDLKKECMLLEKHKVRVLTIDCSEYPPLLKEIYDPPVVLYIKGNICPEDKQAVAIVGARRASYYGLRTARRLAQQLSARGFTIISGLARGVDSAAHEGALLAGGRTVAVFGCGLDRVYPPENRKLLEKIIGQGAVITEFPFGMPPYKQNFPKRNRIISGLSLGVVVVEAGRRSGSLITARLAAEQGREVFSVPGRIDAVTSQGTNVLIRQGAKPVLELGDVLEELKYLTPLQKQAQSPRVPQEKAVNITALNPQEKTIYQVLDEEGLAVDQVVDGTGLPVNEVWQNLAGLELKGLVARLPGSRYARK